MNREAVEKFVAELESTDLPQAYDRLCAENIYDGTMGYCALGIGVLVAAREMNVSEETRDIWLGLDGDYEHGMDWPIEVTEFYGIKRWITLNDDPLINMEGRIVSTSYANDTLKLSFWEIAQLYRATYLKDQG